MLFDSVEQVGIPQSLKWPLLRVKAPVVHPGAYAYHLRFCRRSRHSSVVKKVMEEEQDWKLDRRILELALPALGTLAIDPLLSLVDTAYVGHLGSDPLSALAPATGVFTATFLVFNFLSQATTPLVGQALGSRDLATARRTVVLAQIFAATIGITSCTALQLWGTKALALVSGGDIVNQSPQVLDLAVTYLRLRALGLPAVLVGNVSSGALRALLDTKTPLRIAIGCNVVNAVLDPVLIFGIPAFGFSGIGIGGAALSTVVAEWVSVVWFVLALAQTEIGLPIPRTASQDAAERLRNDPEQPLMTPSIDVEKDKERPYKPAGVAQEDGEDGGDDDDNHASFPPSPLILTQIVPILQASGALLLRTVSLQSVLLLSTTTIANGPDGQLGLAAHQVSLQVWLFLSFVLDSIETAAQALIAESTGQGQQRQCKAIAKRSLLYGVGLGTVAMLMILGCHQYVPQLFTSDDSIVHLAAGTLILVACMQPLNGVAFVGDGILSGKGDFKYMSFMMVASAAVAIPVLIMGDGSLEATWWGLFLFMVARTGGVALRIGVA